MATSRSILSLNKMEAFKAYCSSNGWIEEPTVGEYEILRMRRQHIPKPLLVYKKLESKQHATVHGISLVLAKRFVLKEKASQ